VERHPGETNDGLFLWDEDTLKRQRAITRVFSMMVVFGTMFGLQALHHGESCWDVVATLGFYVLLSAAWYWWRFVRPGTGDGPRQGNPTNTTREGT